MNFSNTIEVDFLEALRLCLSYGYITKSEVVTWADQQISFGNLHQILIDISSTENKRIEDLNYILNTYIGDEKPLYSGRIVIQFIYNQLISNSATMKEVAHELYKISLKGFAQPQADHDLCYEFDNLYYAAENGISGNLSKVSILLSEFLSFFSKLKLDNYEDWGQFNETINRELLDFAKEFFSRIA